MMFPSISSLLAVSTIDVNSAVPEAGGHLLVVPTLEKNKKEEEQKAEKTFLKVKFTPQEDIQLVRIMLYSGLKNWNDVAKMMRTRNARQCRDRWNNYLNPNLRNEPWTEMEDRLLLEKHKIYGTQWRKIALFFRNRSDNSVRNRCQLLMRRIEKYYDKSQSSSGSSSDQN